VFFDRTAIADGEALAGLPPAGNAAGDTRADHIKVLGWALELLPVQYRPGAENPDAPQIFDSLRFGGGPYGFAATCREAGVGFSWGAIDAYIREANETLNSGAAWYPAITADGDLRKGPWRGSR
jgi:hypothetical protein